MGSGCFRGRARAQTQGEVRYFCDWSGYVLRMSAESRAGPIGLYLAAVLAVLAVGAPARSDAFVYWSGLGSIGRAEADGTNVQNQFIPVFNNSGLGLAVDDNFLYGADN